ALRTHGNRRPGHGQGWRISARRRHPVQRQGRGELDLRRPDPALLIFKSVTVSGMTFAELSTYLDRMESTRSRNELVKTLAELYARTSPDEIQPVTYLIQGRLAPFFEPVEIGMGEKLVIAAIAQASDRQVDDMARLYDKLGDLGLVAA